MTDKHQPKQRKKFLQPRKPSKPLTTSAASSPPNPKSAKTDEGFIQPIQAGKKVVPPLQVVQEVAHVGELATTFLHDIHVALIGSLQTLERVLPPLRLFLVGLTSIWSALNAVYFSKKSMTHRTAQVVISVISSLTVVLSLIIPHLALAMLIIYASVELFREFSHFFEALKDYWKLHKVRHALNQGQLRAIRAFIYEKAVDIFFGCLAVAGAVLILFSTTTFLGIALPILGLGLLVTSGVAAVIFHIGLFVGRKISKWQENRSARQQAQRARVTADNANEPNQIEMKSLNKPRRRRSTRTPAVLSRNLPSQGMEFSLKPSTVDIYQTLDILKAQANEQSQLVDSGWVKQPLSTAAERQTKREFWQSHRLSPFVTIDSTLPGTDCYDYPRPSTAQQSALKDDADEEGDEGVTMSEVKLF